MKKIKLLIIGMFLCIGILGQSSDDWRPYNHWKIHFIKDGVRYSTYVDKYYLKDALTEFYALNGDVEIRCIARDFYELCNERSY